MMQILCRRACAGMHRKPGVNPAQERCCKDGAVFHGQEILSSHWKRFREGEKHVMRAKSEYICMIPSCSLRTQEERSVVLYSAHFCRIQGGIAMQSFMLRGPFGIPRSIFFLPTQSNSIIPPSVQSPADLQPAGD